jgi:hypothetical protein
VALKKAGQNSLRLEKIELINYNTGIKDSNDLEAGTKTTSVAVEASGIHRPYWWVSPVLPKTKVMRLLRLPIRFRFIRMFPQ